ncbi:MAG: ligase-associated DNA damage response endonuclease PdeM [Betaproteobacteria bacterium]
MTRSTSDLDLALPPPPSATGDGVHATALAGEPLELLATRALHWPRERIVFVADVHLGKAATFRAGGVPLPRGCTAADLARLTAILKQTGARRLVVLGDFLHAAAGRVAALDAAFRTWRDAHAAIDVVLVRGNHDDRAGDPPATWGINVVAEPHPMAPFLACHQPVAPRSGYALCGHVHPGVTVHGAGDQSERLPCFVLGRRRAILPAFGGFTGLASAAPLAGDRLVAIAGRRLFALPVA